MIILAYRETALHDSYWVVKQKQLIRVSIELCVHILIYQECEEAHLLLTKRHDEILITCCISFLLLTCFLSIFLSDIIYLSLGTTSGGDNMQNDYPDGKYVKCIVLGPSKSKGTVELSMRESRVDKEKLDNDSIPKPNDIVHAYVVSTTKMGCFVRLSRSVEGRVILKELSDEFIPNPAAVFPPGRLVVGKVKSVKESSNTATKKGRRNQPVVTMVDIDMRESVLLTSADRLSIDDIKINSKYTGVITRVESYGVFVRIDNSDVSGLAHVSECADSYIKNIFDLYNPGDFVKLVVIQMDKDRLAFSLKASNFDDSDDDSSSSSSSSDDEDDAMEVDSDNEGGESDSDDENFVAKLAKKMEANDDMDVDKDDEKDEEGIEDGDDSSNSNSSEGSSSDSESSDSESEDELENKPKVKTAKGKSTGVIAMDTNVGFDWGGSTPSNPTAKSNKLADESSDDDSDASSSSDEEDSDDDDADTGFKSSHKSRKKAAAKRREEEETSRRELALADGTADETPETSADFERLVASSPNSSEVWIKYMAFHLSLADIDSARNVANRAFERIEFRQEGEKVRLFFTVSSFACCVCSIHLIPIPPTLFFSVAQRLDSSAYIGA